MKRKHNKLKLNVFLKSNQHNLKKTLQDVNTTDWQVTKNSTTFLI